MPAPLILAFDAFRRTGWAHGPAGGTPTSGSFDCAREGASRGAIFAGACRWLAVFLPDHPADILCIEAPIPGGGTDRTSLRTNEIGAGLPAVIEAMCYEFAIYRQERVVRSSILKHFIGIGKIESDEGKRRCMAICRHRGWIKPDDADQTFDRSDGLACWSFAEATFASRVAQPRLELR